MWQPCESWWREIQKNWTEIQALKIQCILHFYLGTKLLFSGFLGKAALYRSVQKVRHLQLNPVLLLSIQMTSAAPLIDDEVDWWEKKKEVLGQQDWRAAAEKRTLAGLIRISLSGLRPTIRVPPPFNFFNWPTSVWMWISILPSPFSFKGSIPSWKVKWRQSIWNLARCKHLQLNSIISFPFPSHRQPWMFLSVSKEQSLQLYKIEEYKIFSQGAGVHTCTVWGRSSSVKKCKQVQ